MTFGDVICRKKHRYFSGNFAFDNANKIILNELRSKSSLISLQNKTHSNQMSRFIILHMMNFTKKF